MARALRRPGILVYWQVERGSVVVHSQTLRASESEVAAMVEGAIRHGTTMSVEGNYVDSHGQSEIGFGITMLMNVFPVKFFCSDSWTLLSGGQRLRP